MKRGAATTCLDEDDLVAFLAGMLDAAATGRARAHIASCDACRAVATAYVEEAASDYTAAARATAPVKAAARYVRLEELGEGGLAKVYRAEDRVSGAFVALKVLRRFGANVDRRFLREAAVARALDHPGIVSVVDVLADDGSGQPAIVMELLEGSTLAEELARRGGRLSAPDTCAVLTRVAEAMAYVHRAGVVHRDLKPSNVFLEGRAVQRAKVLDLGLAKVLGDDLLGPVTAMTETGHIIGTPGYMAPEQLAGERDVDARADVFGLGVIAFECLTGALPYPGRTPADRLRTIRSGPRAEIASPSVPPELAALVARMIRPEREQRPASMEEVVRAVSGVVVRT